MKIPNKATFAAIIAVLVIGAFAAFTYLKDDDTSPAVATTSNSTSKNDQPAKLSSTTQSSSTEDLLLYLIEEEKMAHDVYTVMYEKYGANVFSNILKSESTHQAGVLTLLQARNIADPRSSDIGVFKNQELQDLYIQLIAQGNRSATEAYKVGVAIEEKDIKDISVQLSTATDEDVITTLESLRSGSENHLRAFNRQQ